MAKRTGPGIVFAHHPDPRDPEFFRRGDIAVLLANFDIGGDDLKKEHRDWIDKRMIPELRSRKTDILVEGFASSSGRDRYNKALSERRAKNVVAYLKERGIPDHQLNQPAGHGEKGAAGRENKYDRAVSLSIINECYLKHGPCVKPDPPPQPKPTPVFESVPLREVYMKYIFTERGIGGQNPGKPSYKFHPWRLLWQDLSQAPKGADKRTVLLARGDGIRREFDSGIQRALGFAIHVDYKIFDYYYQPSARPGLKRKFELPRTANKCLDLLDTAIMKKDPPR